MGLHICYSAASYSCFCRPTQRQPGTALHLTRNCRAASLYGPRPAGSHPAAFNSEPAFAALPGLNGPDVWATLQASCDFREGHQQHGAKQMIVLKQQPSSSTTSLRNRVQRLDIKSWAANRRLGQVLQAIVDARVVDVKEVLEAAEFVERVRRRVRRRVCLDLAAGHGLVGALLALDPAVENVIAVDTRQPASHALLLNALATVAPEAAHKVSFFQADLSSLHQVVLHQTLSPPISSVQQPQGDSLPSRLGPGPEDVPQALHQFAGQLVAQQGQLGVVAVHACGSLTDTALDLACALQAPVAAMACCYTGTCKGAPLALRRSLGIALAADVDRCYRLQRAGCYSCVDFAAIPKQVTPMNRIIIAEVAKR